MNHKNTYRVVLSTTDISYIIGHCQSAPPTQETKSILRRLIGVHARITNGVDIPFNTESRQSMVEKLGFDTDSPQPARNMRHAAYLRYLDNPTSVGAEELKQAETYMWQNDLFTPEQLAAYEAKVFGGGMK